MRRRRLVGSSLTSLTLSPPLSLASLSLASPSPAPPRQHSDSELSSSQPARRSDSPRGPAELSAGRRGSAPCKEDKVELRGERRYGERRRSEEARGERREARGGAPCGSVRASRGTKSCTRATTRRDRSAPRAERPPSQTARTGGIEAGTFSSCQGMLKVPTRVRPMVTWPRRGAPADAPAPRRR